MIIVEQDKTYFVNFNNVAQISLAISEDEETEYGIMAQTIDKEEILLGIYTTEERAKEVLFEIIEQYCSICDDTNFLVYEMPEE